MHSKYLFIDQKYIEQKLKNIIINRFLTQAFSIYLVLSLIQFARTLSLRIFALGRVFLFYVAKIWGLCNFVLEKYGRSFWYIFVYLSELYVYLSAEFYIDSLSTTSLIPYVLILFKSPLLLNNWLNPFCFWFYLLYCKWLVNFIRLWSFVSINLCPILLLFNKSSFWAILIYS